MSQAFSVSVAVGAASSTAILGALVVTVVAKRQKATFVAKRATASVLADWRFDASEWALWHRSELRRVFRAIVGVLVGAAFVVAAIGWAVSGIIGEATPQELDDAVTAGVVIGAMVVAIAGLSTWLVVRSALLTRDPPQVSVLDGGVQCGGVLHAWDTKTVALRGATLRPGAPAVLELTTGASPGLRHVSTGLAILALAGGQAAPRMQTTIIRVPVPSDRMAEAERVARILNSTIDSF